MRTETAPAANVVPLRMPEPEKAVAPDGAKGLDTGGQRAVRSHRLTPNTRHSTKPGRYTERFLVEQAEKVAWSLTKTKPKS